MPWAVEDLHATVSVFALTTCLITTLIASTPAQARPRAVFICNKQIPTRSTPAHAARARAGTSLRARHIFRSRQATTYVPFSYAVQVHVGRLRVARCLHCAFHRSPWLCPSQPPRRYRRQQRNTATCRARHKHAAPHTPALALPRRPCPPFAISISGPSSARSCFVYLSLPAQLPASVRNLCSPPKQSWQAPSHCIHHPYCRPSMDRGSTNATYFASTAKLGMGVESPACERVGKGYTRGERARLDLFLPGAATHRTSHCSKTSPRHSPHTSAPQFTRTTSQTYLRSRRAA
jgi:hypothetical protein